MPANAGISSRHRKVPLSPARVRDDPLGDSCASTLDLRDNGITSAKEFAMRIKKLPVVLVSIFLLSVFSSAQVLKIVVDDTIQAATQERIERAIDQAATERDDAVLIELSTPGGLMDSMRRNHEQDSRLAGAGHHLRDSEWQPRCFRRIFHSSRAPTLPRWRREPIPELRIRSAFSAGTSRAHSVKKSKMTRPP